LQAGRGILRPAFHIFLFPLPTGEPVIQYLD
jgi:hypothetical protein